VRSPGSGGARAAIAALLVPALLSACAPEIRPAGPALTTPHLEEDVLVAADGARLPVRRWLPEGEPRAVLLALHGFNDYSFAFDRPGRYWAAHGLATYAYDQRGFGAATDVGYWAGTESLIGDLKDAAAALRKRHPDTPLFLLGESMGGAVLMAAANPELPPADGLILVAPAVRARESMGAFYRTGLWLSAHLIPFAELSGEGLGVVATDNLEVLRAMQRDPLVLKTTRVDAVWGLVDLMDRAVANAAKLNGPPTLVVYGTRDEIVPREPVDHFVARLPDRVSVAVYDSGYHMLLRDLGSQRVLDDVLDFIARPGARLPSRADAAGTALFDRIGGPGFD
jgi:alpha-beta hydrolase superfamily lysophospholipase